MISLTMIWVALGIGTVALALYRKFLSMHEEDYIHLGPGEERDITKQSALAHKMEVVDRWGKKLTIVTVIAGLVLAAIYLYQQWQIH